MSWIRDDSRWLIATPFAVLIHKHFHLPLHRYAYFEENMANRPDPTWSKILIVQQLFSEGAEYVFWMDADSLFIHDGVVA